MPQREMVTRYTRKDVEELINKDGREGGGVNGASSSKIEWTKGIDEIAQDSIVLTVIHQIQLPKSKL